MATDPIVPFQFLPTGSAEAPKVQADFDELLKYIRDRNNGTVAWDALSVTGTATFTGDVYTVAYTDYSSTSTITGWASFTTKLIYYKKIGKLVYIFYQIDGTSNATTVTFTLPFTASNTVEMMTSTRARDNNVESTTPGSLVINPNSSTVNLFKDWASGAWTNANRKIVSGQFFYQTT